MFLHQSKMSKLIQIRIRKSYFNNDIIPQLSVIVITGAACQPASTECAAQEQRERAAWPELAEDKHWLESRQSIEQLAA